MKGIPSLPTPLKRLNRAQFLGALNDNILKLLIVYFLISIQGSEKAGMVTAMVGAAFVLPFLLFSAPAGCLADRFGKRNVIVAVKAVEVVVTLAAVAAFAFEWHSGLYVVMFLMGTHSAFFAPAKYGIIPELVAPSPGRNDSPRRHPAGDFRRREAACPAQGAFSFGTDALQS